MAAIFVRNVVPAVPNVAREGFGVVKFAFPVIAVLTVSILSAICSRDTFLRPTLTLAIRFLSGGGVTASYRTPESYKRPGVSYKAIAHALVFVPAARNMPRKAHKQAKTLKKRVFCPQKPKKSLR